MWKIKTLAEMSSLELYQCYKLRIDTFVVDQKRIYHELDNDDLKDLNVFHLNNENKVDAYARVFPSNNNTLSFGRVVTAKNVRGTGLGNPSLMKNILKACQRINPKEKIVILAQQQVTGYYEKFGFKKIDQPFIHERTPHVKMMHLPLQEES